MPYYLSKSDFTTAYDCPTKLFYKKMKYGDSMFLNEYLRHLAKGGYLVGKLATLKYPEGITIDTGSDIEKAVKETQVLLEQENVTIFEAAILSGQKLIRIDILVKNGKNIDLIEVKSKSYDSTPDDKIQKKMMDELQDYILDVAYQYSVLKEVYPNYNITPYLYMPDKAKTTSVEGMNTAFKVKHEITNTGFQKFEVSVEPSLQKDLIEDDILTLLDVTEQVKLLLPAVRLKSIELLKSIENGLQKIESPISKNCFKCQFNISNEQHPASGFDECWKDMPKPKHHIRELYHCGTIGGTKNPLSNSWIQQKKVDLFEVPLNALTKTRGIRQQIQIKYTKENKEWFSNEMKGHLKNFRYPLHFIDFETVTSAIPFHKGMRPYEMLAFQWSCHTIERPSAEPKHSEWINIEPSFPSFKFAESLKEQIGTEGSMFMWAPHENTTLKNILNQYEKYEYNNEDLKQWLQKIVKIKDGPDGRFIDQNKFTFDHYFHPMMKGQTSIKKTFPAVLSSCKSERIVKWLKEFEPGISLYKLNGSNEISNPYEVLPPVSIYDEAERVNEGTGAMKAYEDLMYGIHKGDTETARAYEQALLRYCKLDTLAMVIIWEHWSKSLL